ncbi:hypothetical protein DFH07DRAFT_785651 [Mycena maculata]|uniref:Uncharacterized protein n=1 Tax=Mycena maculata TaxID=230809 RepID=A0AAD7H9B7_9AGAR|nr:hypothetical protein DFH07DRAFT_785651 [Mycena maculata]
MQRADSSFEDYISLQKLCTSRAKERAVRAGILINRTGASGGSTSALRAALPTRSELKLPYHARNGLEPCRTQHLCTPLPSERPIVFLACPTAISPTLRSPATLEAARERGHRQTHKAAAPAQSRRRAPVCLHRLSVTLARTPRWICVSLTQHSTLVPRRAPARIVDTPEPHLHGIISHRGGDLARARAQDLHLSGHPVLAGGHSHWEILPMQDLAIGIHRVTSWTTSPTASLAYRAKLVRKILTRRVREPSHARALPGCNDHDDRAPVQRGHDGRSANSCLAQRELRRLVELVAGPSADAPELKGKGNGAAREVTDDDEEFDEH